VVSRVATGGLLVVAAAGAWLVAAPFVLRFQPHGARWTGSARLDVTMGAVLLVSGLIGLLIALAGRVRELYLDAERREAG
jgi:hypothetical protein